MKGKRRYLEWGKNLAIVLLSLSAAWLLTMTPLVRDSGLLSHGVPAAENAGSGAVTLTAAAYPCRMAINTPEGRYGVQYNQAQVDSLFARVGPLLGEALTSAGQSEAVDEAQWQACLQGEGIYFDFSGQIPLSALGSWLHPGGGCPLSGSARRLVLAQREDGRVALSYQEASGVFFACTTDLSVDLHLDPAVEGVEENGARFAFEDGELARLLDPYTLITEEASGTVYAASTPISANADLSGLLEALSFNGQNHTSVSGGEAYLEGESRLEVRNDGTVLYRAAREGKYPVAHSGEESTLAEMIETVRKLAEDTVGARCGDARLHLISAAQTQDGWQIRFGYQLSGSSVWLYEDGWAAQFLVRDGYVAEFTLRFRSYSTTGEQEPLLSMERAAAMLPALTLERRELVLQYRDQGEGEVAPIWVAQ
ncbi:MAG TPA: hypothetical protein IAC25_00430 [Candidatus Enterenecus stercoripullorum]|nr:hypothetical protein [Candidatus Enterenecus stercoripullorum]